MAGPLASEGMSGRHRRIPVHGRFIGFAATLLMCVVVTCMVMVTIWVAMKAQRVPAAPPTPPVHGVVQKAPVDRSGCGVAYASAQLHVARLARGLADRFHVERVTATGTDEDHAVGLAVDFYFPDREDGGEFARYVSAERERLGANFVAWAGMVAIDGTWLTMKDRGSMNANHYDHVHVSFRSKPPRNVPECEE